MLGVYFGRRLTRDLLTLELFARDVSEKGLVTGHTEAADSLEVASLAQSINRMLDHLKHEHDKLNDSERHERALLDNMNEGIVNISETGMIELFNPAAERLFGYRSEEVVGKNISMLMPEPYSSEHDGYLARYLHTGQAHIIGTAREVTAKRSDGSIFPMGLQVSEFFLEGRRQFIGCIRDITKRKQAESELIKRYEKVQELNSKLQETQNQLLQSEKMASIGQLAAGVAHEINNPIGYVYSNLGTLEKYVQDILSMINEYERAEDAITDSEVRTRLQLARKELDIVFLKDDLRALMNESKEGIIRVKDIVRDLKDFAHVDASAEWHFSDLHKGLDSTLNIVNNEIKYKAELVKEYGDLPQVECLPSQINQVFLNLLMNASHAIEERGTITIRTGTKDEQVWVEIEDTGKGIAPKNLKRIFEPFFTTKPVGSGTGLGLSLSYSIIQKHHGHIEVNSELGIGTRFRVWLPIKQQEKLEMESQSDA